MIYLNNNFSIEYDTWRQLLKGNDSKFIKHIFRKMYVFPQEVATRSVVQSDRLKTPKKTHTRKVISPLKMKTLESKSCIIRKFSNLATVLFNLFKISNEQQIL